MCEENINKALELITDYINATAAYNEQQTQIQADESLIAPLSKPLSKKDIEPYISKYNLVPNTFETKSYIKYLPQDGKYREHVVGNLCQRLLYTAHYDHICKEVIDNAFYPKYVSNTQLSQNCILLSKLNGFVNKDHIPDEYLTMTDGKILQVDDNLLSNNELTFQERIEIRDKMLANGELLLVSETEFNMARKILQKLGYYMYIYVSDTYTSGCIFFSVYSSIAGAKQYRMLDMHHDIFEY